MVDDLLIRQKMELQNIGAIAAARIFRVRILPLLLAVFLLQHSALAADTDSADSIERAEAWFADITTMQADFIQIASDGSAATGALHLSRPHRMKIIYELDEPLVLLTTPVWLHVDRPNEKRVTSYPIRETPLSLILQQEVKLRSSDFTTRSKNENGIVSIVLTKETGTAAGELTLEFTEKPFELRRWTVRDAADVSTTITLQNMSFGHSYENKFFAVSSYDENG